MPTNTGLLSIFSAKTGTGTGTAHKVESFDKIFFQFGSAASANFTVKFQISFSDDKPDFSASQSVTNNWDYVSVIDLQSGAAIAGDTGIVLTGTDDVRNLELNASGARWICATKTASSAGSLTLKAYAIMPQINID